MIEKLINFIYFKYIMKKYIMVITFNKNQKIYF